MKSRVRLPVTGTGTETGIKSSTPVCLQTEANVFIVQPIASLSHSSPSFTPALVVPIQAVFEFQFCIRRRSLLVFRLQLILDLLMRRLRPRWRSWAELTQITLWFCGIKSLSRRVSENHKNISASVKGEGFTRYLHFVVNSPINLQQPEERRLNG